MSPSTRKSPRRLRGGSLNSALLRVAERAAPQLRFVGAELISDFPLFNPDLDTGRAERPRACADFGNSLGRTGGLHGPVALFPTLQLLGAVLIDPVSVSRAQDRLDPAGNVFDPSLYQRIEFAMDDLQSLMTPGVVQARSREGYVS